MRDYAERIKAEISMQAVCDRYGIEVTRNHKALCPFHKDSRPSMQIYASRRGWYCFVCGKGGSVIDFVMEYFGLSFLDAVRKMNDDFSLGLDIDKKLSEGQRRAAAAEARKRAEEMKRRRDEKKRLYAAYNAAYDKYAALDIIVRDEAPKGPYDEITERYAEALKHIDAAWEEVQEAAAKLREFEKEGKK